MSKLRKQILSGAICAFIAVHVLAVFTTNQHWPFMTFRMFSDEIGDTFECPIPFAVAAGAEQQEFILTPRHTGIFPPLSLQYAFRKMLGHPERNSSFEEFAAECPAGDDDARRACASRNLVEAALRALHDRYQNARAADPELPPLQRVRLYNVVYHTTPGVAIEMKSRELLVEWTVPGAQAASEAAP